MKDGLIKWINENGERAIEVCDKCDVALFDTRHPANIGGGIMHFAVTCKVSSSNQVYLMVKDDGRTKDNNTRADQ